MTQAFILILLLGGNQSAQVVTVPGWPSLDSCRSAGLDAEIDGGGHVKAVCVATPPSPPSPPNKHDAAVEHCVAIYGEYPPIGNPWRGAFDYCVRRNEEGAVP